MALLPVTQLCRRWVSAPFQKLPARLSNLHTAQAAVPVAEHSGLHAEARHAVSSSTCVTKGLQVSYYQAQ